MWSVGSIMADLDDLSGITQKIFHECDVRVGKTAIRFTVCHRESKQ